MGAVKTLCYPIWFRSPEKCYPIWVHINIGRFRGFFKILFPFSQFYAPIFSEKREQKSKNTPETPNAIIYMGRKARIEGS